MLSKAQIVKTGKLGKALGVLQRALAVILSVPSSKRPQPGTTARYTRETPLYMAHLGSPSSSHRPARQKYPGVFNGSARFKWSSINQILPICWEEKSRDKGAEKV